jgi:hypothetical protein
VERIAQAMADHANEDRYVLDNGSQSTGVEPYEASAEDFADLAEVASRACDEQPLRGDAVHEWLLRQRDKCDRQHPAWTACDWLVGDYERRSDADLTLGAEHDRA